MAKSLDDAVAMGFSMIGQLRKLRYLKGLARMVLLEVTQIAELKVSLGKFYH